jgi:DNA primase
MNLTEHLLMRHVDITLHQPIIDDQEDIATFRLWNLSGELIGFQQYRRTGFKLPGNNPKLGKYFTYRKRPTISVFGVESLHLTPNVVFLCEGIFDACRLTERGFSALASLSNDPSPDLKNWLRCLNRPVVAVCDNDMAGRKLSKFGSRAAYTEEKDLGDSSAEFVESLIKPYKL